MEKIFKVLQEHQTRFNTNILIIGPPGSGKSSYIEYLKKLLNINYIPEEDIPIQVNKRIDLDKFEREIDSPDNQNGMLIEGLPQTLM